MNLSFFVIKDGGSMLFIVLSELELFVEGIYLLCLHVLLESYESSSLRLHSAYFSLNFLLFLRGSIVLINEYGLLFELVRPYSLPSSL